jgi:hypothetical protein
MGRALIDDAKEYIQTLHPKGVTLGLVGNGVIEVHLPPRLNELHTIIDTLRGDYKAAIVDTSTTVVNGTSSTILHVWWTDPSVQRDSLLENPRSAIGAIRRHVAWGDMLGSTRSTMALMCLCVLFMTLRWWEPITNSIAIIFSSIDG